MRSQFPNERELAKRIETDNDLKREVNELSKFFLNKSVSGCSNCFSDALISLMILDINKAKQAAACGFELNRGVLLKDVKTRAFSLHLTQANISNDLALFHVKTNPSCAGKFKKMPDNLNELLASFDSESYRAKKLGLKVEAPIIAITPKADDEGDKLTDDEMIIIADIKILLAEKTSKTQIKAKYAKTGITGKRLGELIKIVEQA